MRTCGRVGVQAATPDCWGLSNTRPLTRLGRTGRACTAEVTVAGSLSVSSRVPAPMSVRWGRLGTPVLCNKLLCTMPLILREMIC